MNSNSSSRVSSRSSSPIPLSKKRNKRLRQQDPTRESFYENESLARVSSAFGVVDTPVLSTIEKDIVLDRLEKEIVRRFGAPFSRAQRSRGKRRGGDASRVGDKKTIDNENKVHSPQHSKVLASLSDLDKDSHLKARTNAGAPRSVIGAIEQKSQRTDVSVFDVVKKRVVLGTNQCTRRLEAATRNDDPVPSLLILARDVRPPTVLAHIPVLAKNLAVPTLLLPGKTSSEIGSIFGINTAAVLLFLPSESMAGVKLSKDVMDCQKRIDSFVAFAASKTSIS